MSQERFEEVGKVEELGEGAYFWVYISPENETAKVVKDWTVILTQGNWTGSISSDDPTPALQTKGMFGVFDVKVIWRQPPSDVVVELRPGPESKPDIGCSENCASMIGIVAGTDGAEPTYWTTWDAFCKK